MIWWKERVSGFFDHPSTQIGSVKTRLIRCGQLSFAQAQVPQNLIVRTNEIIAAGAGKSYLLFIPFPIWGSLTRQIRHLQPT
jgi:hypothetical protein